MAASVQQRIACGERAGQQVRRIGSGFGSEGEVPRLMGPHCARVNGFSLHANTSVPAHRRDQLEGSVSKMGMAPPLSFIFKMLFPSLSTLLTPPSVAQRPAKR